MRSINKWTVGTLSLFVSMVAVNAGAAVADMKIATVDMQQALQTVDQGKKARSTLEKEFNVKKETLQKDEQALKQLQEDFRKKALVLSEEARAKKQAELQEKYMKLQEQLMRSQQEIQKREQDLTKPIIDNLKGVIAEVAKEKGYNYVLEKNENSVLYSPAQDDLTADIIEKFNKKHKG